MRPDRGAAAGSEPEPAGERLAGRRRTGVVDYRAGNLRSVETALRRLGADFFITAEPEEVRRADRLLFPGVGEARASMAVLKETGLGDAVVEFYRSGRPLLGICIGCQIVLERSEESETTCLGIVPGGAVRFPSRRGLKVPHMGWNQVVYAREHVLFRGIPDESSFYFVHSYYPLPAKESVLAYTEYGLRFASAIEHENLLAVQFHPEKSGDVGLRLLANFLGMKR